MLKPIISVYLNIYFWINYLNSNLRSNELGIVWVFFYIIESPCFRIWLDFFINSDLVQRIKSSTYVHMNDDGRTQTEANGVKWLSNTKKKKPKKEREMLATSSHNLKWLHSCLCNQELNRKCLIFAEYI